MQKQVEPHLPAGGDASHEIANPNWMVRRATETGRSSGFLHEEGGPNLLRVRIYEHRSTYLVDMKDKVSADVRRKLGVKAKRNTKRTRTIKDVPARKSWADDLFGSAHFTEEELGQDERLRDLVERASTKPTRK